MLQTALIVGVLGLPVVVAIWLALNESGPPDRVRWAISLTADVTALCALGLLLFFAEQVPPFTFTWLPTAGPMRLSLATTSLYAVIATAMAVAIVYLIGSAADMGPRPSYSGVLALTALAAGNLAFLSAHFLLRYVALEVVGLCIAAAPLLEEGGRERFVHAGWIYLLLRFGDAGLLTAILLLGAKTGAFEISAALEAVATLPVYVQIWINLGFFLAVAVKIGVWPFYAWIDSGRRLARNTSLWLYATLMPNLGLYLLYRVAALPTLLPETALPLHTIFLIFGVGGGMLTLFALTQRPSAARFPARSVALLTTLVWCAALLGGGKVAWWGLLALSLVRLPIYLAAPHKEEEDLEAPAPTWERWDQQIERVAHRIRDDVESTLERGLDLMAGGISTAARYLYNVIEQQSLEGLLREVVRKTLQAGRQLQNWHTGRLRANLWWVILCLVLAVGFALGY
ncbi:MAG: proton-conducting transporter membrane subunit [Anaerolineales bacterium]